MSQGDLAGPFHLTIELLRAKDTEVPRVSELGSDEGYHRRIEDALYSDVVSLDWESLKNDLLELQKTPRGPDKEKSLGSAARAFLRGTRWPENELSQAAKAGLPVRLTFLSAAGELYSLPWELLSPGEHDEPLAQLPGCLIRYQRPGPSTEPRKSLAEGGRVLFAWSDAGGDLQIKDRHLEAIFDACSGYLRFDPDTDTLGGSALSIDSLDRKLREATDAQRPYSILHLLCHGAPLKEDPGAFGLAWGSPEEPVILRGAEIGEKLGNHAATLRLVVVCACQSGDASAPESHFGGVAPEIHGAGIEAVVASRFPMSKEGSALFTRTFYSHLLAEPASVEDAFLAARKDVQKLADDLSLQLYARHEDGWDTRPVVVRPYRGLSPFTEADQRFFFGRGNEIEATVEGLLSLGQQGLPRFLVVAGASGTGKSSMVFAGVAPELRRRGWTILSTIHPGTDPGGNLARAKSQLTDLTAQPSAEKRRFLLIVDQLEELFTSEAPNGPGTAEKPDGFVQDLWALASAGDPEVAVLATMRVDFLGRAGEIVLDPQTHTRFDKGALYQEKHRILLAQMGGKELREAIEMPANKVGLSLEPGLVERMLTDVGHEPGALPLLQFTLDVLWQERAGRKLTQAAYNQLGGITGALTKSADQVLQKAAADLGEAAASVARHVLLRLVALGHHGAPDTRRHATRDDLALQGPDAGLVDQVLARFVEARLLVWDSVQIGREARPVVQVAHEALIRSWKTLKGWVNDSRKLLSAIEQLDAWMSAKEAATRRNPNIPFFLADSELAHARALMTLYGTEIAADASLGPARELIAASEAEVKRREDEKEAARERELAQARRAREFSLVAGARELIAKGQPWWAMALLAESEDPGLVQAWEPLARDVLATPWLPSTLLSGHRGQCTSVAWSPDGTRIVTASTDQTARVSCADGTGEPFVFRDHEDQVSSAQWSPDGKRIVTASNDKTARVWNADGTGKVVVLSGHDGNVWSAAFCPDGERVVTASNDKTARVWNADGTGKVVVLKGHGAAVVGAQFSNDGKRIVTASNDKTARVWNADGTGKVVILSGHGDILYSAVFSPDGKRVVTASSDKTARVWNADGTGKAVVLKGHEGDVRSAAWSPHGERIVTASGDGTARVWSSDGKGEPVVLRGHETEVTSAAFSPDGQLVITRSLDGTVRAWKASGQDRPVVLRETATEVERAAMSPDGGRIAVVLNDPTEDETFGNAPRVWVWRARAASEPWTVQVVQTEKDTFWATVSPDGGRIAAVLHDGTARVWTSGGSEKPLELTGHAGDVGAAVFSADGRHVVTTSGDGTARVWNLDGPGEAKILQGHQKQVVCAELSADGKRIVTASEDGTARVWSAEDGRELAVLLGHEKSVTSAAFSADAQHIVTASDDQTVRVWRADGKGEHVVLRVREDEAVSDATFSPEGERVVALCAAEGAVRARVWRADGKGELAVLQTNELQPQFLSVSFSPDGHHLLTSSELGGTIWSADDTSKSIDLVPPGEPVRPVIATFSPDGRRVAVADTSDKVWLWSANGIGEPVVLPVDGDGAWCAKFSGDGQHVMTLHGATIRLWVTGAALRQKLRDAGVLPLSPRLRQTYLGETPEEAEANHEARERALGRTPPPPE